MGAWVGGSVGAAVGGSVGAAVGGSVGAAVGGSVGAAVGGSVGAAVGGSVGASVGGSVGAARSCQVWPLIQYYFKTAIFAITVPIGYSNLGYSGPAAYSDLKPRDEPPSVHK